MGLVSSTGEPQQGRRRAMSCSNLGNTGPIRGRALKYVATSLVPQHHNRGDVCMLTTRCLRHQRAFCATDTIEPAFRVFTVTTTTQSYQLPGGRLVQRRHKKTKNKPLKVPSFCRCSGRKPCCRRHVNSAYGSGRAARNPHLLRHLCSSLTQRHNQTFVVPALQHRT